MHGQQSSNDPTWTASAQSEIPSHVVMFASAVEWPGETWNKAPPSPGPFCKSARAICAVAPDTPNIVGTANPSAGGELAPVEPVTTLRFTPIIVVAEALVATVSAPSRVSILCADASDRDDEQTDCDSRQPRTTKCAIGEEPLPEDRQECY
ncbi:MAG: hypothetical protein F4219_05065 [Gammaproteobacteria bacterium]|nr:hypothetical protein [Gammaproteobacteria bacterium]